MKKVITIVGLALVIMMAFYAGFYAMRVYEVNSMSTMEQFSEYVDMFETEADSVKISPKTNGYDIHYTAYDENGKELHSTYMSYEHMVERLVKGS